LKSRKEATAATESEKPREVNAFVFILGGLDITPGFAIQSTILRNIPCSPAFGSADGLLKEDIRMRFMIRLILAQEYFMPKRTRVHRVAPTYPDVVLFFLFFVGIPFMHWNRENFVFETARLDFKRPKV